MLRLNLFPTIIRDISTVLFPRFTLCSVLLLYYRSSFSTACLLTCIVFKFYNEIALTFSSYLFICRCILNLFRMQIQIPNVSVECKYNNGYRFYYVFYDRIFIIYCLVPLRSIREKKPVLFLTMQTILYRIAFVTKQVFKYRNVTS